MDTSLLAVRLVTHAGTPLILSVNATGDAQTSVDYVVSYQVLLEDAKTVTYSWSLPLVIPPAVGVRDVGTDTEIGAQAPTYGPDNIEVVSDGRFLYLFALSSERDAILCDRFILDPNAAVLNRPFEVRKINNELAYRDSRNNPYIEPTIRIPLSFSAAAGRFGALLIPTNTTAISRWQFMFAGSTCINVTSWGYDDHGVFATTPRYVSVPKSDSSGFDTVEIPGAAVARIALGIDPVNGLAARLYGKHQPARTSVDNTAITVKTDVHVMAAFASANGTAVIDLEVASDGRTAVPSIVLEPQQIGGANWTPNATGHDEDLGLSAWLVQFGDLPGSVVPTILDSADGYVHVYARAKDGLCRAAAFDSLSGSWLQDAPPVTGARFVESGPRDAPGIWSAVAPAEILALGGQLFEAYDEEGPKGLPPHTRFSDTCSAIQFFDPFASRAAGSNDGNAFPATPVARSAAPLMSALLAPDLVNPPNVETGGVCWLGGDHILLWAKQTEQWVIMQYDPTSSVKEMSSDSRRAYPWTQVFVSANSLGEAAFGRQGSGAGASIGGACWLGDRILFWTTGEGWTVVNYDRRAVLTPPGDAAGRSFPGTSVIRSDSPLANAVFGDTDGNSKFGSENNANACWLGGDRILFWEAESGRWVIMDYDRNGSQADTTENEYKAPFPASAVYRSDMGLVQAVFGDSYRPGFGADKNIGGVSWLGGDHILFWIEQTGEWAIIEYDRNVSQTQSDTVLQLSFPGKTAYQSNNSLGQAIFVDVGLENASTIGGIVGIGPTRVSGAVEVIEFGMVTRDVDSGLYTGSMIRLYGSVAHNKALTSVLKVTDIDSYLVGNATIGNTLLGYIEGAPPLPLEQVQKADPAAGGRPNWAQISAITVVEATNIQSSWTSSRDAGLRAQIDSELDEEGGVGVASGKLTVKASLETSSNVLDEGTVATDSTWTQKYHLECIGDEHSDGRPFEPYNVGAAWYRALVVEVRALVTKDSRRFINFALVPTESDTAEILMAVFPIDPRYTRQGSLDGRIGSTPVAPATPSYYRPPEAVAWNDWIDRKHQERVAYAERYAGSFDKIADPSKVFQKSFSNKYAWTPGAQSSGEVSVSNSQSFTVGATLNFQASATAGLELSVGTEVAGIGEKTTAKCSVTAGATLTYNARATTQSQQGFQIDEELQLNQQYGDPGNSVKEFAYTTFFLEADDHHFDDLFQKVIDQDWLQGLPSTVDSNTVHSQEFFRDLMTRRTAPWRVLHRVTFVDRGEDDAERTSANAPTDTRHN